MSDIIKRLQDAGDNGYAMPGLYFEAAIEIARLRKITESVATAIRELK